MDNEIVSAPALSPQERFGNGFGISEAIIGVVVGFLLSTVGVSLFDAVQHRTISSDDFGSNICSLIGLWIGFAGSAIVASHQHARRSGLRPGREQFVVDYGAKLRPWPDLGVGIVVGVASQYLLIPLLELPLLPFVPHLFNRLSDKAVDLTTGVNGFGLVVLGIFICLGSPLVEELFFRGLILRGLLGRGRALGPVLGWVLPVLGTGVIFGLLHFEALQLIGLMGFGVVLSVLATKTGRLGPGLIAHIAFNTVTFIGLAITH